MGFIIGLKNHDKTISFADIIKREHVEEYFRSHCQEEKGLRIFIRSFFLEFLQNEGFPFRKDDFDEVFDTSLNDKTSDED